MKSPFRRRRRRPKGRGAGGRSGNAVKPQPPEVPESIDWPQDGNRRTSLMGAIRGDGETGAGFGGGMFEELHAAFSGSKKIQLEEQEAEKMRRHDDHRAAGTRPDSLDSGTIRIRRPGQSET